jgi:hypothetical protein
MSYGNNIVTDKEKKVKTATVRRPKFADEKYMGPEPTVDENASQVELSKAYTWFNYFYNSEDAKNFTISYLKYIKYDKDTIKKLSKVNAINLHNIGWNSRLLHNGSTLPDGVWERCDARIKQLVDTITINDDEEVTAPVKVISIQDRINNKAAELIGELEEQLDVFFQEGVIQFDVKKWSLEKGIKPQIAKRIADKFRPQFAEITEALEGKDPDLVEAYKGWRKPVLKIMALFIKRIIDHMIELDSAGQAVRKPRKKKVKPASVLVAKMKYKENDGDLKSVNPCDIIGASQLWVYNTKTRNLSVYNAVGNSGLSVRGTTLTGFDEESSITKKLRKPESVIKPLLDGGKIYLRKVMENIKTVEQKATGRINVDTILLRVVK